MIDNRSLDARLARLKEFLKILETLKKKHNKKEFINDYMIYGIAERYLHLSVEAVIDISDQIISEKGFKKPEAYKDSILILAENKVLPATFAEKILPMIGFRNILVHNYLDIDTKLVFKHLQEDLDDFRKFMKFIVKYTE